MSRRCVKLAPNYSEGQFTLALALAETGRIDEATETLRYIIDGSFSDPIKDRARAFLAHLSSRTG